MAVKNTKSEKDRMLDIVRTQLRSGEKKLNKLIQVLGSNEDSAMTRVYLAITTPDQSIL